MNNKTRILNGAKDFPLYFREVLDDKSFEAMEHILDMPDNKFTEKFQDKYIEKPVVYDNISKAMTNYDINLNDNYTENFIKSVENISQLTRILYQCRNKLNEIRELQKLLIKL